MIMRRIISCFLFVVTIFWSSLSYAELAYVCVSEDSFLNGRSAPNKNADVTMRLFSGDEVDVVSFHGEWAEIIGGESGTSFCKAEFLSSIKKPVTYVNTSKGRVRVRKTPIDGKPVDWIGAKETIVVTKIICGWGLTNKGWIDLSYFKLMEE